MGVGEMGFKASQGLRVRVCVRLKWTLLHSLNLPCVLVRTETHNKVCYAFWSEQNFDDLMSVGELGIPVYTMPVRNKYGMI